jgi:PNKP (polynucleotide 5'-kinase/3'-phosphatase) family adenylyltransferase-like protein
LPTKVKAFGPAVGRRAVRASDGPAARGAITRLRPFHLLASADSVHIDKTYLWHMETLPELCAADGLLYPTAYLTVDTTDAAS